MRTTLEIDETVLAAARSLARAQKVSLGAAVSELALRGMRAETPGRADLGYAPFPVLAGDPRLVITDDLVNSLRDG